VAAEDAEAGAAEAALVEVAASAEAVVALEEVPQAEAEAAESTDMKDP
jgi:hypothetical protein